EARPISLLENPLTGPHGNPIPGAGGPRVSLRALADSEPGERVRLERATETVEVDQESLAYLDAHNFRPGTAADVRAKAPDGTLTLALGDETLALGPALAQQLFVSRSQPEVAGRA